MPSPPGWLQGQFQDQDTGAQRPSDAQGQDSWQEPAGSQPGVFLLRSPLFTAPMEMLLSPQGTCKPHRDLVKIQIQSQSPGWSWESAFVTAPRVLMLPPAPKVSSRHKQPPTRSNGGSQEGDDTASSSRAVKHSVTSHRGFPKEPP